MLEGVSMGVEKDWKPPLKKQASGSSYQIPIERQGVVTTPIEGNVITTRGSKNWPRGTRKSFH